MLAVRELAGLMNHIVQSLGFVEHKTRAALAREVPTDPDMKKEFIDFNRRVVRRSDNLLPQQQFEHARIATVRSSTCTGMLKCLQIGGVRTPHAHINMLSQSSALQCHWHAP